MYVFIKDIIEGRNCYSQVHFFFDKKQDNFEHVLYSLHKKWGEKNLKKKWIVARRPQSSYQEK